VPVGVRVEVSSLSASALGSFRDAMRASFGLSDERGFGAWAGIHGLPLPISCQHHTQLFLPWHRAYLYLFEKSLQDRVAGVALPWWDWTSATSHTGGIPRSYTQASGADRRANPLRAGRVSLSDADLRQARHTPGLVSRGRNPTTVRDPDVPDALPRAATIDSILNAPTFADFSSRLENVHDSVHVWVGGSMSQIPIAAFDPLFWAHHTMIDRLWSLWQQRHPNAPLPPGLADTALAPFPLTVAQVLEVGHLGYDYATAAVG
jgi:tyrosinase